MKRVVVVFIFIAFLVSIGSAFLAYRHFLQMGASSDPSEVIYEISHGKPFNRVSRELEEMGLISNGTLFSVYAKLKGEASRMKMGEYALRRNMTPNEILSIITSGKSIGRFFTVSEGLNIFEIADLYQLGGFGTREDFLSLCRDPDFVKQLLGERHESLEGYLFPETYQVTKFTTTKELLQNMVRRFQDVYRETLRESEISGLNKHQIVTLASIIEKETGAPQERPSISSIFHNRMKKGMMLQTDPTILYGMAIEKGKMVLKISKSDILRPTRYNTYTIRGLPPGPISNPGREALLAAIKPAQTDFLYFVSKNNGTSIFSKDFAAHNRAVQKYQVDAKAREGKSWRDLKKKNP